MQLKTKIIISRLSCLLFTGSALGFARKFSENPEQYQSYLVLTSMIALCLWSEWDKLEKKTEVTADEESQGN